MKMFRALFVFAALLLPAQAIAQWQVPAGNVPIGLGAGKQGFGSAPISNCATALTYLNQVFGCNTSSAAVSAPGGRLSLISGQAEMSSDVTSQNLYLVPGDNGNTCPVFNGTSLASYPFVTSPTDPVGLTLALGGSSAWPAGTTFDVFCILNNGVVQLATRAWDASMLPTTVQISGSGSTAITTGTSGGSTWSNTANAFNGTLSQPFATSATASAGNSSMDNCLGQDLGAGASKVLTKVSLTEPSDASFRGDDPTTLPTTTWGSADNVNWQRLDPNRNMLSTSATYGHTYTYSINATDATPYRYFRVCFMGVAPGSAIRVAQMQLFTTLPPATRRLVSYGGFPVNDAPVTAQISSTSTLAVPQYQATYRGSFRTDAGAAGQITANFGYGPSRVMNLWNYYNRKTVTLIAGIPALNSALPDSATFRYTLTWPAWQDWQGVQSSTSYSVQVLVGYVGDSVRSTFTRAWYINGGTAPNGSYEFGIGVDSTTAFSCTESGLTGDNTSGTQIGYYGNTICSLPPFFGTHTLYGIERLTYVPTATVSAFQNIGNTGLYVTTQY